MASQGEDFIITPSSDEIDLAASLETVGIVIKPVDALVLTLSAEGVV